MSARPLQQFLWVAAAVVVPATLTYLLTSDARAAVGLTLPPFVWPRLLVAHLALAVPLGLWLGAWLVARPSLQDVSPITWAIIGGGVAGLVGWLSPTVTDILVSSGADGLTLLLFRCGLAVMLVLPWCIPAGTPAASRWGVVAALGLAILPSALYADGLATAKTEQIRELIERERLVRARRELTALRELGTDRTIGSETPMNLAKRLDTQIRQYEKAVSWPLPANATIEHKLQRALMLIPLDRLDEAATLLKPLAASGEFPAMLLATVYQEQERWAESDEWFARGLSGSPATVATALDGLIFNARESRRPADVEQWLRRGLELFPDRAAEFHYKLGQHYAHAGKPNRAVTAFTAAAAADPKRYAELARTQMDQLRTGTPACLLRLPPGGLSASVP